MGRLGKVLAFERDDDGLGGDVKVDPGGGDSLLAEHYGPAGDDSPPLAGDWAALEDSAGSGVEAALGYVDGTEQVASPGEKRIYARDTAGTLIAEIYLQGDGTITIKNLAATSPLGVVTVEASGQVVVDGDVVARPAGTDATKVTLSQLLIPSPMGPLGPPIPGT